MGICVGFHGLWMGIWVVDVVIVGNHSFMWFFAFAWLYVQLYIIKVKNDRKIGIVIFILLQEEYLIFVLNSVNVNSQK